MAITATPRTINKKAGDEREMRLKKACCFMLSKGCVKFPHVG